MSEVAYVSSSAALQASRWEQIFQRLPASAGVLFISIRPRPAPSGLVHDFDLCIGISPKFSEGQGFGLAVTKYALDEDYEKYHFNIQVVRGVLCAGAGAGAGADSRRPDDGG